MIEKLKSYWRNHKTKATGLLMVLSGCVHQYSDQLQTLLKPKHYSMVFVGAGVIVALLGFLNSQQNKQ